jgi:hypothetical protein
MGFKDNCQLLVDPVCVDRALDVEGSGLNYMFEISATIPPEVSARFGKYDVVIAFAAPGDYALVENLSLCGVEEVHAFLPYPPADKEIHAADHVIQALCDVEMALMGETPLIKLTESKRAEGLRQLEELGARGNYVSIV